MVGVVQVEIDRDKMSGSGAAEQPAKKAASPLYLGFDFSTQQVRKFKYDFPSFLLWKVSIPPSHPPPSQVLNFTHCKPYAHMCCS
jgi:hypothetical protein